MYTSQEIKQKEVSDQEFWVKYSFTFAQASEQDGIDKQDSIQSTPSERGEMVSHCGLSI